MKKKLSILIISILVAFISIFFKVKSLFILPGIIYIVYCFKNPKRCFWITYFIALLFPIGLSNNLNLSITIIICMVVILYFVILIHSSNFRRFKLNNFVNITFFLLSILYCIYFFVGLSKGYSASVDFKIYAMQIMLFYCTYKVINEKDDIYKLMNMTVYAMFGNAAIGVIIYLTKNLSIWNLQGTSGRFGYNAQTLFIITLSYMFFLFYNRKYLISKSILICSCFLSIILIILSQNRTNPVLILINFILIILISFTNKISLKKLIRKMGLFIFIAIVVAYGANNIINSNSNFINRYKQISSSNNDDNLKTRMLTFDYYLDLIEEKPLGNGFGIHMPFVDAQGNFQIEESLNTDNAYINIAYKAGIIGLILYIILICSPLVKMAVNYRLSKDKLYLSMSTSYFMLLIGGSMFTSQIIHSYAVSTFMWVFISYINLYTDEKLELYNKENK
ncbi:O-antigen ligase family protein [Clostridium sp. YIM B02555]|uniref:O-antigen ligase family protein n=1 Tax=Clostridium sp. YIM B02555 TaxID=2911968 RepID=UPI001EEEA6A0